MTKMHSKRYRKISAGICNPDGGWERSTWNKSKVTCKLCRNALVKEGLLPLVPSSRIVSIQFDTLQKLKTDLAKAKAWKRNALEALRRL